MKGVFSLEESLGSLDSLDSLESPESGRILFCFPQSGHSQESLGSGHSQESSLESLNSLSTFSLLIGEDFWLFLDFASARSVFCTLRPKLLKKLRSLGKSRERQKSSRISEEKVNKVSRLSRKWTFLKRPLFPSPTQT